MYARAMEDGRRKRFEDHWPWYFRLFIRVLDERSRWVIAADSPCASFSCRPGEPPDLEVREFIASTPASPWGLRRFRLKRYPVRSEEEIFRSYQDGFERACEVYAHAPQEDGRVHVLLLRTAEYGDSAIIVTAYGQAIAEDASGEAILRIADCRTRLDFRRMANGDFRVSQWVPRSERSTQTVSAMLERMRR
jgi:hypothetical protein